MPYQIPFPTLIYYIRMFFLLIQQTHYHKRTLKVAICRGGKGRKDFFFFFMIQPFWKYSLITLLHILPQCLWYFSFKGFSFEESFWRENWGIVGILDKTETESYITRLCSRCTVKSFIRASEDWAIKANKLILFLSHTESQKWWPLFMFKLIIKHKYWSFAWLIFDHICFE